MPLKNGELTRRETEFIRHYFACGGDRAKAEKAAGYAPEGGYQVLARPEVQSEIVRHQLARLTGELLPLAIEAAHEILTNKKAPAAARAQVLKIVLDRALPLGEARDVAELSPEEIAGAINALEREAAAQAKVVSPAPDSDPLG